MRTVRLFLAMAVVALSSGCATITSKEMQELSLTAQAEDGKAVEKAKCSLKNERGEWQAETPSIVSVRRSSEDLIVECKKDGHSNGSLRAISRAAGGMFGNIIFGGGIGAIIDHSKGTGYNYPDNLPVKMGQSITVDRHQNQQAQGDKPQQDASK